MCLSVSAGTLSFLVLVSFSILSLFDGNIIISLLISYGILLTEIVAIFNMMAATVTTGAGLSEGYMDFTFAALNFQGTGLSKYLYDPVTPSPICTQTAVNTPVTR